MTEQRSLLDALEPIDPRGFVDRIPGVDAPCMCGSTGEPFPCDCGWPFCQWKTPPPSHPPTEVVETEDT